MERPRATINCFQAIDFHTEASMDENLAVVIYRDVAPWFSALANALETTGA